VQNGKGKIISRVWACSHVGSLQTFTPLSVVRFLAIERAPAFPADPYFAGLNNQVNTRATRDSAIITSAQKKEMKSL